MTQIKVKNIAKMEDAPVIVKDCARKIKQDAENYIMDKMDTWTPVLVEHGFHHSQSLGIIGGTFAATIKDWYQEITTEMPECTEALVTDLEQQISVLTKLKEELQSSLTKH